MWGRHAYWALTAVVTVCMNYTLWAASDPVLCDPTLRQSYEDAYGYRLRHDRCEGIYVREVSSTTLLVASLTEAFENYDLTSNNDLQISWKVPRETEIRIRAQGLRRRLYYRMDTLRRSSSAPFRWPTGILAALQIPSQYLGVTAWASLPLGKENRDVYLPIRVSQRQDPKLGSAYALVLLPGAELTEVYLSLATVGADGKPVSYLRDGEPLKYGYYPAERRIDIPLALGLPGLYFVQIGAELKTGGTTTLDFLMYHPAR
jgi:hypothetical protein